jgi:hypothetical protein
MLSDQAQLRRCEYRLIFRVPPDGTLCTTLFGIGYCSFRPNCSTFVTKVFGNASVDFRVGLVLVVRTGCIPQKPTVDCLSWLILGWPNANQ